MVGSVILVVRAEGEGGMFLSGWIAHDQGDKEVDTSHGQMI